MVELRNIYTQIKDGDWIESKDQSAEGIRLIQTGNIGIGTYLDKDNRAKFISEETFNELKCTEVFEGDILISRLPSPVGRACLVPKLDGRAITAVDCTILRVDRDICIPKYFVYYTMSDMYLNQIDRFVVGTTRARISRKNLEGIKIFLPEISKQKKIVEVLDKAQELIDKRKEQIEALDELVKSKFIEMFGDPVKNPMRWKVSFISELCENLDKMRIPITSNSRVSGNIPYYGASGIVDYVQDYIFDETLLLVSEDGANLLARVTPIAFEVNGKSWVNNHAHVLRFKNYALQKYIEYAINLQDISQYITGTTQPKLNQAALNKFKVPVPSNEKLNEFLSIVNQLDKLKSQMETSLKELEDNFNCLMQKAFKGELF